MLHVIGVAGISSQVARVVVPAQQGPAGPPGPAGTDHGYVVYAETPDAPALVLAPDTRQQLVFAAATTTDSISATSPFKGHAFWDGAVLRPRAAGDTAILRLDLTSIALVANGSIEIQLDIGGSQGVIQQVSRALKAPAGALERISEAFPIYMGATFLADGGTIFLEASVPTEIQMVSLILFPLSAATTS